MSQEINVFSFLVIVLFGAWIGQYIHMLENYRGTEGYTVKILSLNLYPSSLLNTHPTSPPGQQLVSSGSFQRPSMQIQTNECVWGSLFFLLITQIIRAESLSINFPERRKALEVKRKHVLEDGGRREGDRRWHNARAGCIGPSVLCCWALSVRQKGRGVGSWQALIAMLWDTDLIWLVAGLQQRVLSARVTCANWCFRKIILAAGRKQIHRGALNTTWKSRPSFLPSVKVNEGF